MFALIGIALILIYFITGDIKGISLQAIGAGFLGGSSISFITYFFEKKKQYLTIKDGELIKNSLFSKKIKLSEITSVKEFAGDMEVKSENGKLSIDMGAMEPESLEELRSIMKKFYK